MFRSRDHGGRAMPEARSVRREVVIKSGIYPGGMEVMEVCSFCQELKTCTSFNYSVRASLLFALEITLGICRLQEYLYSK